MKAKTPTLNEMKPLFALFNAGRHAEMEAQARLLVSRYPDSGFVWKALGVSLQEQGKPALDVLQKAAKYLPNDADTHHNLGNALRDLGRLDEAMARHVKALAIEPDFAIAHNGLGNVLLDLGRLNDAQASYAKALKIRPDFAEAHSGLLFTLNFDADKPCEAILAACREYDKQIGLPQWGKWPLHGNTRERARRLRIGYVSPDFRRHPVAYFAEPILANHDPSQVEIFCYAEVRREDDYTVRFRELADHWHSTVGLSDDAAAQMIHGHQIDILVDLAGHTRGNRLPVFARKPAPIQATYLGYPGSTGLSAMDYRLTDRHADPESSQACYTEPLLHLPDSLWCYHPSADMPEISPLPALSRGYLTFGSFNNANKIDPITLELWAALLRALPTAHLMLITVADGGIRQRLMQSFAGLGVHAERLEFHGKLSTAEFHRQFCEVDITLDPVTVNGATTTCESLWMGVPVISLTGKRFLTRAGWSLLNAAGLADFAATSPEDYIRIAARFAGDFPQLATIRAGLRTHIATSPLIDEVGFTRNLESSYRKIWVEWCNTR